MNETITEQTGFPEKMSVDTELISQQINDVTEKIGTNTEQIDEFSEIIPEKITEKSGIEAKEVKTRYLGN